MLHHNRGGANDRRQAIRERLNNGNGPMSTSSASDRDTQAATTIREIGGHACNKVGLDRLQQRSAHRVAQYVAADLRRTTIEGAKFGYPMRIRRRSDVKHEICLKRDTVLVSETCEADGNTPITFKRFSNKTVTKLPPAEITCVNHRIRRFTRRTQQHALRCNRIRNRSRCIDCPA